MKFQDKIRNPSCTLCPLHKDAEYVCLMGSGTKKAKIMIVGEAPGAREDEEHAAFVGPAGALLTELLEEAGIKREDCYITNAVKCRPSENATPGRAEVKACSTYLADEIEAVKPTYILGLGNVALQTLTGRSGITKYRGKVFPLGAGTGVQVLPTFHPAAALRSSHYLPHIRSDIAALARYVSGTKSAGMRTRTRLITTPSHLKALVATLGRASTVAFDLETTGLHEWEDDAKIVTIGVCWAPGECAVIPVHHENSKKSPPPDFIFAALKPILESKDKKFIAHNAKFDAKWLAKFGIYVPVSFDTMIAAHLLDENRAKGLKPLSELLLGADSYGIDVKDAYHSNLKKLAIYNGKDCDYTMRLYHIFREQLKEEPRVARLFKLLMMPASDVFTRIEMGGTYVDPIRLLARTSTAERNVATIEGYMDKFLPKGVETINYNSSQQVGAWLFGHLKLPIIEETKTGAPSTAESSLLRLADKHKVVNALLKYRKWSKYLSTYLSPWDKRRDAKSRLHPSYRLTGTVTGRLSSSEPNLQQVPRDPFIRSILGAPAGWRLIEADYSQVELRLAAMLAPEKTMQAILNSGEDLHYNTACAITGKKQADITKDERVIWGKHPNFGLIFGMKPKKYWEYCRDNGIYISLEEATRTYNVFHATYPGLLAWHARQGRIVRASQRVQSPIGRVRHLPDIRSSNESVRAECERFAINSPVQSFASDLCLLSAVRLGQTLDHRVARLVGSIHDSILLEVREDMVEETVPIVRDTMQDLDYVRRKFGTRVIVPLVVDVAVSQHWSEDD